MQQLDCRTFRATVEPLQASCTRLSENSPDVSIVGCHTHTCVTLSILSSPISWVVKPSMQQRPASNPPPLCLSLEVVFQYTLGYLIITLPQPLAQARGCRRRVDG